MATYIDMQNRIANDLRRDDLGTEIAEAIQSAIQFYRNRPVVQSRGTLTPITAVEEQKEYTLPSDFIAAIQMTVTADGVVTPMTPRTVQWIDQMDQDVDDPIVGVPTDYALTSEFEMVVYPRPDSSVTEFGGRAILAPAAPSDDDDTNFWTERAERAIRCQAVALLYDDTLHDPELAEREYAKSAREWSEITLQLELRAYSAGIRAYDE